MVQGRLVTFTNLQYVYLPGLENRVLKKLGFLGFLKNLKKPRKSTFRFFRFFK